MIEITPAQATPALASMFHLGIPTGIRALAVLAGGNNGRIFTDDLSFPHWCFVQEADDLIRHRGGDYSARQRIRVAALDGQVISLVEDILFIAAAGMKAGML